MHRIHDRRSRLEDLLRRPGLRQFTPGATDKVADPKFTSATNLILQTGSPTIDLGTTKYDDRDVDGNPVFAGARVDAGAYEFQG